MRTLIALLFSAASFAQVNPANMPAWWLTLHGEFLNEPVVSGPRVSISPQGAAALKALTGKRIPGVQILSATICSSIPVNVSGGAVYQALAEKGVSAIAPKIAGVIIASTVNRNGWKIALEAGKLAAGGAALFGASGIIAMSSQITTGLLFAHQMGDQATPYVQSRIPDPSPLLASLIDPESTMVINAGACRQGMLLAVYDRSTKAQVLQIK